MRLFVINLHRSLDRRLSFLKWVPKVRLPWEIFDAVDGSLLRQDALPWSNDHWGDPLWPGAVGCYASHLRVLQRIVDYDLDWAVVVEDDMVPIGDHPPLLDALSLPGSFDIVYLHEMRAPLLMSTIMSTSDGFHRVKPAMLTTGAYVATRAFARRFLAKFSRIEMPIDHCFRQESTKGSSFFFELERPLFRIDGRFPSTINCPPVRTVSHTTHK